MQISSAPILQYYISRKRVCVYKLAFFSYSRLPRSRPDQTRGIDVRAQPENCEEGDPASSMMVEAAFVFLTLVIHTTRAGCWPDLFVSSPLAPTEDPGWKYTIEDCGSLDTTRICNCYGRAFRRS